MVTRKNEVDVTGNLWKKDAPTTCQWRAETESTRRRASFAEVAVPRGRTGFNLCVVGLLTSRDKADSPLRTDPGNDIPRTQRGWRAFQNLNLGCKRSFCPLDCVTKSRHIAQYACDFAPCQRIKILAFATKAGFKRPLGKSTLIKPPAFSSKPFASQDTRVSTMAFSRFSGFFSPTSGLENPARIGKTGARTLVTAAGPSRICTGVPCSSSGMKNSPLDHHNHNKINARITSGFVLSRGRLPGCGRKRAA